MSKSVSDVNEEYKKKYRTKENTKDMFPVGSRVRVICVYQDCYFFYPEEDDTYGTVTRIGTSGMIIVKWDVPKQYPSHLQEEFNFDPEDLLLVELPKKEVLNYIRLDNKVEAWKAVLDGKKVRATVWQRGVYAFLRGSNIVMAPDLSDFNFNNLYYESDWELIE